MSEAETVRVLLAPEVEALIAELRAFLSTLPDSLPVLDVTASVYTPLIGFPPNPELFEDRGEVGAVNTAFKRMFGPQIGGLKIVERGKCIKLFPGILEHYLKKYPGDIIIQKWLTDAVSSARLLVSSIFYIYMAPNSLHSILSGDISSSSIEIGDRSLEDDDFVAAIDEDDDFEQDENAPSLAESHAAPTERRSNNKEPAAKRRKTKQTKSGPAFDAIPTEHDNHFHDVISTFPPPVGHGRAPSTD
ncbi:hypothetical protein FRC12_019092 [Ceratobasidium sp. 428]|nr:hypothetical protein FRC12_019092 [Ceratobasidium sp. 428]